MTRDLAEPLTRPGAEAVQAAAWARRFWWACALAAPPVAWAVAAAGYPLATRDPLPDLALLAVWSVAEEIVFRGALQPTLQRVFERRGFGTGPSVLTLANVVTSLLFAAFHLWRHPLAVALGVFALSLIYGKARELSGRWWPAAALHFGFNVALYAASWLLVVGR